MHACSDSTLVMRVKSIYSRYFIKLHAINMHTHVGSLHAYVKFKLSCTVHRKLLIMHTVGFSKWLDSRRKMKNHEQCLVNVAAFNIVDVHVYVYLNKNICYT